METSGEPGHIHCSEEIYILLEKTKRFVLEPRDQISVKGKGIMQTYWLQNEIFPNYDDTKMEKNIQLVRDNCIESLFATDYSHFLADDNTCREQACRRIAET